MDCYGFIQGGRSWFPIFTILLFAVLIAMAVVRLVYQVRADSQEAISAQVSEIATIMQRIDEKCKIIGFDLQKTPIDFLNVVKFAGSEVGVMSLAYPQNWEGPYLPANPMTQGKEYQIVRTKKGYFITPGDGVQLGNGKIVGKDIVLDENADIAALMKSEDAFMYKGKILAAELPIKKGILQDLQFDELVMSDEDLIY